MRKDIDNLRQEITSKLEAGFTQSSICSWLNCKEITLVKRLKEWGISHLKNPQRKGIPHLEAYKSVNNYLYDGSQIQSYKLKLKLLKENIKEYKCENCALSIWLNKPIPL